MSGSIVEMPVQPVDTKRSQDQIATDLVDLLEGYFDEVGLSEEERDERYQCAAERVSAFVPAIAASSEQT